MKNLTTVKRCVLLMTGVSLKIRGVLLKDLISIFILAAMSTYLSGCEIQDAATQESFALQTTISSDGQVIAVMQNPYTDKLRVRFKRLDQPHEWEDLPVPAYTTGIHFGLTGHQLLLTYRKAAEGTASDLVKWDLDAYQKSKAKPVHIYSSTGMDFPIEVVPNEYLVRTCPPTVEDKCHRYFSFWHLIYPDGRVHKYTNERRTNYGTPNIVLNQGFFWRDWTPNDAEVHPSIRSIAFPNKTKPQFDTSQMDMQTQNIVCDYTSTRCLRSYITNPPPKYESYIFGLEVFLGKVRCPIPEVNGWSDGESLTPSGNAAVMAFSSSGYYSPRDIVVLRFKPQQCEPVSVDHIKF